MGFTVPTWIKRFPLFPLLFTYVFVSSAGLVSVLLVLLSFTLWPLSKNAYRRLSSLLAYSVLGRECVCVCVREREYINALYTSYYAKAGHHTQHLFLKHAVCS